MLPMACVPDLVARTRQRATYISSRSTCSPLTFTRGLSGKPSSTSIELRARSSTHVRRALASPLRLGGSPAPSDLCRRAPRAAVRADTPRRDADADAGSSAACRPRRTGSRRIAGPRRRRRTTRAWARSVVGDELARLEAASTARLAVVFPHGCTLACRRSRHVHHSCTNNAAGQLSQIRGNRWENSGHAVNMQRFRGESGRRELVPG